MGAHICSPLLFTYQLREQGSVVSISQIGKLRLRKTKTLIWVINREQRFRSKLCLITKPILPSSPPGECLQASELRHLRPGPGHQAPGLVCSSPRARICVGPARNTESRGPCSSSRSLPSTRFPSGLSPRSTAGGSFAEFCVWGQVHPLSI